MYIALACYLFTAVQYGQRKEWGMVVVWAAYALSIIGFIISFHTGE